MSWGNEVPIPHDEEAYGVEQMTVRDEVSKAHDSREDGPGPRTCQYAIQNEDEVLCNYDRTEINWCGEVCPLMKGERV